MSQKNFRLFVIASVSLLGALSGCGESHQTVEWYQEHKAERDEKLQWCNDDASRVTKVDCLNAKKAKQRAMMTGPSSVESFKFDANAVKNSGGK